MHRSYRNETSTSSCKVEWKKTYAGQCLAFVPFRCCLLLFLIFLISFIQAQQPAFIASVSTNRPTQNDVFDVQFELKEASGSGFVAPSFDGFRVVGGPSIGSRTMIINGEMSQSQSWSFSLLAIKQGKFEIGSASVIAGRKKLVTKPVQIEVIAVADGSKRGTDSGDDVVLRAEVEPGPYYPGQQIKLNYRLLFKENVQSISTLSEDDYADFFVQNFTDFNQAPTYETINRQQYTTKVVKSIALYGHQSGEYTIDPLIATVGVNAPFPGNQGFFTMRRIQDVQVASQPVVISILPLPSDAPATFTGAVGQYSMLTVPGSSPLSTNEAYTFQIEISGNGDSRRWDPPKPVATGEFDQYDPKTLDDRIQNASDQVLHVRKMEYLMVPKNAGDFSLSVPFTYFDPVQKKYITISSDTMQVKVLQGHNNAYVPDQATDADTIPPPLKKIHFALFKDRFWTSPFQLSILGLILLGFFYGMARVQKQKRNDRLPASEKIRAMAGIHAEKEYEQLELNLHAFNPKQIYEQAGRIYHRFLEDRFSIPPSELDEHGLSRYLSKWHVPEDASEQAIQLFRQTVSARYGLVSGDPSKEEIIRRCRMVTGMLSV